MKQPATIPAGTWRRGLLPGSEDLPERQPAALGHMRMNILFYKGEKAACVDFVDLKKADEETRATVIALQGLVARELASAVYITVSPEDDMWADYCAAEYGTVFESTSLETLFRKYRSLVKTLVLYRFDPKRETAYEYNIALMMAAQANGLPVTQGLYEKLASWGYDVPVEDIQGRWAGRPEAYRFAIRELLPGCNPNYVAATGFWQYFNDYVYATKTFTFMLSILKPEEKEVLDELLSSERFVRPAIVFGYGQEGDDLLLASIPHGFSYIVNDYFSNSTFFSSFEMPARCYSQPPQQPVEAENGKVYIGLYFSDGDNIQFNQRLSSCIWRNPDRGLNPVGMQLNPVLFEIAPPILAWYYSSLTPNDEIVGGPAGFSYVWEHAYREDCWPQWHAYNNFYLQAAGIRETNTSNILQDPAFADTFTKYTNIVGSYVWHSGVYDSDTIPYGKAYRFNGVPLVITSCIGRADELYGNITSCKPEADKPKFMGVCLTQAGMGPEAYTGIKAAVEKVQREHPGEYEFLLPTQMMLTVGNWLDKQP